MRYSRAIFSAAVYSFSLCSLANATEVSTQIEYTTPWEAIEHGQPLSYDLLIKWYESIENEDENAEFKGTPEELSKMMQWLIFLSKAGVLPKEEAELEKDIEELLQECRAHEKDFGDDQECSECDCERVANLEDIPLYLKKLLLPKETE